MAEGGKGAPYSNAHISGCGDQEHSLWPLPGWVAGVGCLHPLDESWRVTKHGPALAKVVPDGFAAGKKATPLVPRTQGCFVQEGGGLGSYLNLQDRKNRKP